MDDGVAMIVNLGNVSVMETQQLRRLPARWAGISVLLYCRAEIEAEALRMRDYVSRCGQTFARPPGKSKCSRSPYFSPLERRRRHGCTSRNKGTLTYICSLCTLHDRPRRGTLGSANIIGLRRRNGRRSRRGASTRWLQSRASTSLPRGPDHCSW
jgi:hypothetical protein